MRTIAAVNSRNSWLEVWKKNPENPQNVRTEKMNIAEVRSALETLTEALRGIEVELAGLRHSGAAAASPAAERLPIPSPNPRPQYVPTDWPRIGGRVDLPDMSGLFNGAGYRDQYREGEGREIYAGASLGLARLASRLRLPLYKLSTCAMGRLADRMRELGRDQYASEWFCDGEYVVEPNGFDNWFPSHFFVAKPPASNSPVRVGPRALGVRLPLTMSAKDFDLAFDAEIRKAAIDTWVMTSEGARHCAFLNANPAMAQRSTPYPFGSVAKASPAKELAVFRIHEDADRLVAIVEHVILKHFGLIA